MVTNKALKFSVVIPTYNNGHFIGECLNSVMNQTYADWECLVVDDASEDSTDSVMESYCSKDSRITYRRLPVNSGPSIARNNALARTTGDYVLFLDADDLIAPQKLQQAAEIIASHAVDFVFSDYSFFNEKYSVPYITRRFSDEFSPSLVKAEEIKNRLVHENIFAISCIISKAACLKALGYFDTHLNYNEDWDLWLRASFNNPVFFYDPRQEGVTFIRNHGTSHSKDMTGMYISGLYACKKNYNILDAGLKIHMDRKIRYHRYVIKTFLIQQYFEDRELFLHTLQRLNSLPYLEDELLPFRKPEYLLPKAGRWLYQKYLYVAYRIADKCL